MYEIKKVFPLQNTTHENLIDVLKENLKNYSFVKTDDTIIFRYCKHSFGLYYNSFLLEGAINFLDNGDILCKCELPKSVKNGFCGLNFVLLLFLLFAIIKTPEVLSVLLNILFLCFVGINIFAYSGLLVSSVIFYNQLKKII